MLIWDAKRLKFVYSLADFDYCLTDPFVFAPTFLVVFKKETLSLLNCILVLFTRILEYYIRKRDLNILIDESSGCKT